MKKEKIEEFSFKTVKDFDNHINLSIPNYSFLTEQCRKYANYFIRDYTNVIDIGCSSGKFLNELERKEKVNYYGYDVASNLFDDKKIDNVKLINADLLDVTNDVGLSYPDDISFAISLFTLQFLPPTKRLDVINKIKTKMIPGSAFVSCEKIEMTNAKIQHITDDLYHEFKNKSFSGDEILSKAVDLRKIMTPLPLEESVRQLSQIGKVDIFFMSYSFVGIIAIKDYE